MEYMLSMSMVVFLRDYFNLVSIEDYIAASFRSMNVERSKQHVVLYARHHIVPPTETKLGIAQKNIEQ